MPDRVGEERLPCQRCGSNAKHVDLVFQEVVTATDFLEVKSKSATVKGARKIRRHLQIGSQWSTAREKFVDKVRDIDRDADTYFERVIDPETGEVFRLCEEPLSEHFERGSAKKR
ncbi:hypothetical protein [Burkholderia gladioli]|uniref:hypothetical protein n=1 Tax=Burkholderia gladioli TaxID=28095 RepID=UPI0022D05189|nr:hypothetical protein [Burkholderia gladioli]MDA0574110.1 hypothetical protein [Burkholderia gladioli]MDA0602321.1 hypothetical protein [Burkholderia gladioli]